MTDLRRISILTSESVDRLRAHAGTRPGEIWATRFEDLVSRLELTLTESEYEVDQSIALHLPEKEGARENFDAQNAFRALRMLPTLTRADATDERLWVTLALREHGEYTHQRWPFRSGEKATLSGHLSNHLFVATLRARERDQAVSRLWWTGMYVKGLVGDENLARSLHAIYANSDIPVALMGRPNIAAFPTVGRAIVGLCEKHFVDDPTRFKRDPFREFLKGVDLLAGRASFGALSDEDVRERLEARFNQAFETTS